MGRKKSADKFHRGRNSITLGIRISLSEYGLLEEGARKEKITPTELAKRLLITMVRKVYSVSTTNNIPIEAKNEDSGGSIPEIQRASTTNILPMYNKEIHKVGDKVLMRDRKGRLVPSVVPELDADGHVM